jgi:hypothetical protein
VSPNTFVSEHAEGIDALQDAHEIIKVWVKGAQLGRTQTVWLCPMRATIEGDHNFFEAAEELLVPYWEAVRSRE